MPYVPDTDQENVMVSPPSSVTDFGAVAVTESGCGRVSEIVVEAVRPSDGSVAVTVTVMLLPVMDAVSNQETCVTTLRESVVMVVVDRSTLFAENVRLSVCPALPVLIIEIVSPATADVGDTAIDRSGFALCTLRLFKV